MSSPFAPVRKKNFPAVLMIFFSTRRRDTRCRRDWSSDVCSSDLCGIGDENGEFINQLRVYALLAFYLLEIRGERGDIVKTLSTTTMLNKLGKLYNVPVHETGVGFKYVAPKMMETNALIGGEESGGYAFRGK